MVGFHFFNDSPPSRGASDPSPGGRLSTPPARRVGHWRSFFRRGHGGLLCGAGVAPPRGRGRASEARDSFVFSAVLVFAEFYLEFSVGAAISLSFDSFSILAQVMEIHFFTSFSFFMKNILILVWIFYLEGKCR